MKRNLLFLLVMLSGLMAKAQTTDILQIEGVEVTPEETATKTYYLKNVGTGLYMSYGGEWGTHCIETSAAHPIAVETNGEYVAIGSLLGYLESNTLWMDYAKASSLWKLEKADGYTNQYYLVGDGDRVLSSEGNSAGLLTLKANESYKVVNGESISLATQRWVFLTEDDIRTNKMPSATAEMPIDITPFIKASTFDKADGRATSAYDAAGVNPNKEYPSVLVNDTIYNNNWTNYVANSQDIWGCGYNDWDPNTYNWIGVINGPDAALDVTQSVSLKAGTYHFSFEGLCNRYQRVKTQVQQRDAWTNSGEYNVGDPVITDAVGMDMNASVTINGTRFPLTNAKFATVDEADNFANIAIALRDNDTYKQEGVFYLSADATVEFKISKEDATGAPYNREAPNFSSNIFTDRQRTVTETWNVARIYVDEFVLQYYGAEEIAEGDIDLSALYAPYIEANINEYKQFLNDDGDAALDEMLSSLDLSTVDTREEYYNAIASITTAYTYARTKHENAEIADISGMIVNNSFEMGNLSGWTLGGTSADTGVKTNTGSYVTTGIDGAYLFNSWWNGVPVYQTVKGLPKGQYKLNVLVAGGDYNSETGVYNDATVYLFANDAKVGVNPPGGGKTFGDFELEFNVGPDGLAKVGVVGGNDDDTAENPIGSYNEAGYWWYKCDNFRLEYLGNSVELSDQSATLNYENNDFATEVTLDRQIPNSDWSTLVVPFNMAIPTGWVVKELTDETYVNGSMLHLRFADAASIKAGVPYLVRQTSGAATTIPAVEDVTLHTAVNNVDVASVVGFTGSYTTSTIPAGSFYLSGNKFYRASADIPVKGFRAWFTPKSANVKSIGFSFDDADFTGIEDVESNEAETIAIYGVDGTLRSELQKGINIVKMSDGTTKKVMVK